MKELHVFCVESKNSQNDSDGLYIKETINKYCEYDRNKTKFSYIYMNGKNNYNSGRVEKEIKQICGKLKQVDKFVIYYIIDKDRVDIFPNDKNFIKTVKQYCIKNKRELILMNRDIEDVYLGYQVESNKKVSEAIKFQRSNKIRNINEKNLRCKNAENRNTSNILIVLSKYFYLTKIRN